MPPATHRVDYDLIAHLYDEPGRDYSADPELLRFLRHKRGGEPASLRALDLGCGTGKQLAADHARLPRLRLVGLDRFRGMVEQARRRCPAIDWVQGDGMALPFPAASFDYITNQFSYHHVPDKAALFSGIYRVLKPGGRLVITNIDPWSMSGWAIYRFFPASRARDAADFLPEDRLVPLLRQTGFRRIHVRRQLDLKQETLGALLAYASQRHRTSQLIAMRDQEYADGLASIRQGIERAGAGACVPSELCLVWFIADKAA
jgi:ubiquinone/menaquinone biosynthesis C-methylase UbiE